MKIISIFLLLTTNFLANAQEIAGKWKTDKLYFVKVEADVTEKQYLIELELNLDSTYSKTFLKYHPFDSFGRQLPEVNTLDGEALKKDQKDRKNILTATGDFIYQPETNQLTFTNRSVNYTYTATFHSDKLVLTDTIADYPEPNVVIQTFSRRGKRK